MVATADDDGTMVDLDTNGAFFVKKAEAKEGALLLTPRRTPADEMKRSISCVGTMDSLLELKK